jgi:antitoxin (DNA-binding transcriptional repressor) of toxin-antitoxin stability system
MIRINIYEARTHLSRYLAKLKAGETLVLCRRNVPIAEIRSIPSARAKSRPFGLAKGLFKVPDDFNAPLPENELRHWEG